jgi:hypothetical protein
MLSIVYPDLLSVIMQCETYLGWARGRGGGASTHNTEVCTPYSAPACVEHQTTCVLACPAGYWWGPRPARPAEAVAEDLRGRILALYDKYLSPDGKAVRYRVLKQDPAFWEYVDATAELQRVRGGPLGGMPAVSGSNTARNLLCLNTTWTQQQTAAGWLDGQEAVGALEFYNAAVCVGGVTGALLVMCGGVTGALLCVHCWGGGHRCIVGDVDSQAGHSCCVQALCV